MELNSNKCSQAMRYLLNHSFNCNVSFLLLHIC